ncbi:hypothetical protein MMC07_000715 [Pseudocyphellaria aurata]|nr:hypothetical protein [Pseudocyphellaria aurata]
MSNPPPPSGQPTSFRTNVNRAKTKRWVEAKSYSYDGDDWGEVDDYDEYGGYDEPQPPPKPTGLRQRGQSATHPVPAARDGTTEDHQPAHHGRFGYGNLGGHPVAQNQALRSATTPQPQMNSSLARSNSFDRGDENRAFFAGSHTASGPSPGSGFSQAPGFQQGNPQPLPSQQGSKLGLPSQQGPYHQTTSQQDPYGVSTSQRGLIQTSRLPPTMADEQYIQSPAQSNSDQGQNQPESGRLPLHAEGQPSGDLKRRSLQQPHSQAPDYRDVSSLDQPRQSSLGSRTQSITSNSSSQNRHDFSPSAIPPLQTQSSPSPRNSSEAQPSARFPPRKSSLSQTTSPNLANSNQVPQISPPTASLNDLSPSNDSASNDDGGKPRPFVRPADIYKRMQEEKEKEKKKGRQAQESSRPSDAPLERPIEAGPNSSAGTQGNGPGQTDFKKADTSESSQNLRKPLDPVAERKSEYGFDGIQVDDQKREVKPTDNPSGGYQNTFRPILPDVTRMSGFGDLLASTIPSSEGELHTFQDDGFAPSPQPTPQAPSQDDTGTSLQHQTSAGFRSVVHQAFDNQIPATPSSASGSGIGRSTSGGTSLISPIISRDPSVVKRSETTKGQDTRALTPPPLTRKEVESSSGRPLSSSTLDTPKPIVRKPSPSQSPLQGLNEPVPTTFIPGHRRDLSTPSPDNSPARTPILEPNRPLRKPQEVELAMATPTEPEFSGMQGLQDQENPFTNSQIASSSLVTGQNAQQINNRSPAIRDRIINFGAHKGTDALKYPRDESATESPGAFHDGSTRSRAESPSKNRVRDLAGKFESGSPSRRGSETSTGLPGASTPRKDSIPEPRPLADRLESFRPQLPGGWESFSSTAPAKASSNRENSSEADLVESVVLKNAPDKPKETSSASGAARVGGAESPSKTSNTLDHSSPQSDSAQPSDNPLIAVAAAGSALAGAILASVAGDSKDLPTRHAKEPLQDSSSDHLTSTRSQTASVNTAVYPDASAPLLPRPADDDSSESTTPLRKDSLPSPNEDEANLAKAAPTVASQNDAFEGTTSIEEGAHPNPQSMLPPLTTDIRDQQYESDRLRREIVKNLSPRGVSEPTTAESESPWQDDSRLSAAPSLVTGTHDSMVIPSEYDSYWNGSNSGGEPSRTNSGHGKSEPTLDTAQKRTESVKAPPPLRFSTVYPGASVGDAMKSNEPPKRPDLQQHQYSWEKDHEFPTHEKNTIETVTTNRESNPDGASHDNKERPKQYMGETTVFPHSQDRGPHATKSPSVRMVTDDPIEDKQYSLISDVPYSSFAMNQPENSNLHQNPNSGLQQNFVPFEETNLSYYNSGLPMLETPLPLTQINSSDSQSFDPQATRIESQRTVQPQAGNREPTPEIVQPISELQRHDNIASPLPPLNAQPKIPPFREILALKNHAERIRTFDETREQLAHVNNGLSQWIAMTLGDLPEHADIVSGVERPVQTVVTQKPLPFKAKIPGLRSAGAQASQQPYYQQYLNATPQATSSEGIGGQNATGSSSSQGFSPGGKLSTQQVQAKGKDLLQAAGVFGGRANTAAKGLFSKGRSKFRGGSGTDKVTNSIPSPDPFSRGMQPQHQPQSGQSLSDQVSSLPHPLPEEHSNVQSSADQRYTSSPGIPESEKKHKNEPIEDQEAQLSHTHPGSQLRNIDSTRRLSESNNEPPVPPAVRPSRISSLKDKDGQNYIVPASSNELVSPVTDGDASPIYLHATPTAESDVVPAETQRRNSDTSSNQTPTQSHFNRSSRNGELSSPVSLAEEAYPQNEQSEIARNPADRENENQQDYKREEPALQSNDDTAHISPSIEMAHEGNTDSQAFVHASEQRFSKNSDNAFHTLGRLEEPRRGPNTEAQAATQSEIFYQRGQQKLETQGGSSSGLIPPSQLHSTSSRSQRATRPFSFMEYSQEQPTQPRPEVLQRAPSIESIPGHRYLDRPPSPVSPQRSMTREVAEQHDQKVSSHYDTNRDFFPSDDGNGPLRRPRSSSRPFQDPNLLEHPAFRHEGPQARGADNSAEYHSAQRPQEIRLPRQHTVEYQLEGVGPPVIPRTRTKSRSRRSSRSSVFFRNLGNSVKAEGPSKNSPESQYAESPAKDAVASRKKSNRNSVFRTLTGRSGSDRDQIPASVEQPVVQSQNSIPQQPISMPPRNVESDFVASGTSSKARNKLQRASTSGNPDKPVSKKKRFSAIGSLFGRSSSDKQIASAKLTRDRPQNERSTKSSTQQLTSFYQAEPRVFTEQYPAPNRQESNLSYFNSNGQHSGYYAPQQGYAHPAQGDYYAPGRSSQTDRSNFQAMQSHPKPREPPAYVQDSSLRQNSASRSQSTTYPPVSRATAPLPETYPDLVQPRQSHWVRNPTMQRSGHSYSSANTDNGSNSHRSQSIQNSQTQLSWLSPQSTGESYQHAPQTSSAQNPPSTTYSPQPPTHTPSPNINNPHGYFAPRLKTPHTGSPGPPPPPPKDEYISSPPQPSHSPFTTNTGPSPSYQHQETDSPSFIPSSARRHQPPAPIQTASTTDTSPKNFRDKVARKSRQMEIERGSISPPASEAVIGTFGGRELGTTHGDQHRGSNSSYTGATSGTRDRDQRTTRDVDEEDRVVMSSTSYPGQEWSPRWDGD